MIPIGSAVALHPAGRKEATVFITPMQAISDARHGRPR